MASKRISELNELLNTQVSGSDLLLITDISAVESKKIQTSELQAYVLSGTASYSNNTRTASYAALANSASWAPSTVSASYALSSSYADWAKTSSYILSSSYALTASFASRSFWATSASYSMTSSVQFVVSSGLADYADTASYLLYTAGKNNGTASAAISASWARTTLSSSFLIYTAGTLNGTASYAQTASLARSASALLYTGVFNGSASYALRSATTLLADSASVAISTNNVWLYREFDVVTSSIVSLNTASFGWVQFSGSQGNPKVIMEAWGDVFVPITESQNRSGSVQFIVEGNSQYYTLDESTFQYYYTGSNSSNLLGTGSIIFPFYLKGRFTVSAPATQRYSASVLAWNGVNFYTGSRDVQCTVRATTDNFLDE